MCVQDTQSRPSEDSEDKEPESDRRPGPRNKKAQMTVLNEGAIIIKRQTQAQPETSDESEEEPEPETQVKGEYFTPT